MPRYIDADALYDRFQNLACDDWNQGTGTTWANAYAEAADVVDDMPTADVAPLRHGRWVKQSDRTRPLYGWNICSECGAMLGSVSPYCSECGAKMEVEHE